MRDMFGTKFYSIYGHTPSDAWHAAISRLSDQQCARGLEALLNEKREFPPTLPEFATLCRDTGPVRFLGNPVQPKRIGHNQQQWSGYARTANRILLAECLARGGIGERLCDALKAKAGIVSEAETAERNGNPWERTDFVELLKNALETVLGPLMVAKRLNF